MFKKTLSLFVIACFSINTVIPISQAQASSILGLPAPGTMVNLTSNYVPVIVKGLRVHPENPILFDFIVDTGNSGLSSNNPQFKSESEKLVKYFLASLTIPEQDLWVNLSPYEKNRIIPDQLGQTEMGRDMLAQDYILKQLTASMIYPEKNLGKEFWNEVYSKAQKMYGTNQIPVNTFNKVWIVADKSKVFVHDNTAFVVASHLKVMLEEDYLSLQKHASALLSPNVFIGDPNTSHTTTSNIIRSIVLPALEKEVNTGRNFANLRQIFHSMILAAWYKKNLKEALLNQVYSNKVKTNGLSYRINKDMSSPNALVGDPQYIYQQYLKAYRKGVFNYIKEDVQNGQSTPRKYFSGGEAFESVIKGTEVTTDPAMLNNKEAQFTGNAAMVTVQTPQVNRLEFRDEAMTSQLERASRKLVEHVEAEYEKAGADRNDETLEPQIATDEDGWPIGEMKPNDLVILTNHRSDRVLPVFEALTDPDFNANGMRIDVLPNQNLQVLPLVAYDKKLLAKRGIEPAFKSESLELETVSDLMEAAGVVQGRFAESNKGEHVRYFWDGRRQFTVEEYAAKGITVNIRPSEGVSDEKKDPRMQYAGVAQDVVKFLKEKRGQRVFVLVNFATDIQGHVFNGDMERARTTILETDKGVGEIRNEVEEQGGALLVDADHGNVEQMFVLDEKGNFVEDKYGKIPSTQHSPDNPVPFIVEGLKDVQFVKAAPGEVLGLANVGPTVLDIMGIKHAQGMERGLLEKFDRIKPNVPVVLVVRDGWGIDRFQTPDSIAGNPIAQSHPPVDMDMMKHDPWITLKAHGDAVGLPESQMGDSDNGHTTMGAGRIVPTQFENIMNQKRDGRFKQNPVLRKGAQWAIDNGRDITITTGLLSEGGVHSHDLYVEGLLELFADMGIQHSRSIIKLHSELDGRDVMTRIKTQSGAFYMARILAKAKELGLADHFVIGSENGRKYGMDRDGYNGERGAKGPTELTKQIWKDRFGKAYWAKFGLMVDIDKILNASGNEQEDLLSKISVPQLFQLHRILVWLGTDKYLPTLQVINKKLWDIVSAAPDGIGQTILTRMATDKRQSDYFNQHKNAAMTTTLTDRRLNEIILKLDKRFDFGSMGIGFSGIATLKKYLKNELPELTAVSLIFGKSTVSFREVQAVLEQAIRMRDGKIDSKKKYVTLDDVAVSGKSILIRSDINAPVENGKISLTERIKEAAVTIKEAAESGAKVTVIAHQGRPGDADYLESLEQHAALLSQLIGRPVRYVDDLDGEEAVEAVKDLQEGEVVLLKNVRPDESNPHFVTTLEPLFDYFILDGFSVAHRATNSITGFKNIPNFAGRLLDREWEANERFLDPNAIAHPYMTLLGGSKISEHIDALEYDLKHNLIDRVLTGGMLAQLLLIIRGYNLGEKTMDVLRHQDVDTSQPDGLLSLIPKLRTIYKHYEYKFDVPTDLAYEVDGQRHEILVSDLEKEGVPYVLADNGTKTAEQYAEKLSKAKTIFVKGPQGNYKNLNLRKASEITFNAVAKSGAFWMTGGGDTDKLVDQLGLTPSHRSLAGGALLEFKAGKKLPGLEELMKSAKANKAMLAKQMAQKILGIKFEYTTTTIFVAHVKGVSIPTEIPKHETIPVVEENDSLVLFPADLGKRVEVAIGEDDLDLHARFKEAIVKAEPTVSTRALDALITDRASVAKPEVQGGIDLNSQQMQMDVGGQKIDIHFNQAMMAQFRSGDFSGVRVQILSITPLSGTRFMLGLKETKRELASV